MGCATPTNPSFPISVDQGRAALKEMTAHPHPLPRPLVLIGGFMDPSVSTTWIASTFSAFSDRDQIIKISLIGHLTFEGYRKEVLDTLDRRFPADSCGRRREVDVVGFSLGGVIARYAAIPQDDGRAPLAIARLFTISSPHRGSAAAEAFPSLLNLQGDLKYHSSRLLEIDNVPHEYPIYPYARLGDAIVGVKNTAPVGEGVWWVYTPWLNLAHEGSAMDPRILADIARRLRGEQPFSTMPRTPLPK